MTLNDIILLFSLLTSLVALFFSLVHDRTTNAELAYEKFFSFWLEMDSCFIDHPSIHKYFYDNAWTNKLPPEVGDDYDLALCVAERFRDVFQYSEQIARNVPSQYKESYYEYMNRIMNTAIYKEMDKKNPIAYTKKYRIGSTFLKSK